MNKLLFSSIKEAGQKISTGSVKPSEVCTSAVKLTAAIKPLNAYITITDELARKQSDEADLRQKNGSLLGELDGIPIAVKDNFCTKGQLTSCGSRMLSNFYPPYNATVYERLKNAGAVLIGKTNLDEFGMGSGTVDSYFGPTRNLWGSDILSKNYICKSSNGIQDITEPKNQEIWHIAGGSSGGSAVAVASGTCFVALGSDTGGSTRNPASYCGLVGFKPTYGLVSRYGLIPLVNSMDVPGILARNVDDAVLVFNTIAGPDEQDSTTVKRPFHPVKLPETPNVRNFKIGIPIEYLSDGIDKEVLNCWREVTSWFQDAGASIVEVSLPHTKYSIVCYSVLNRCDVASNLACYDGLEFGYRAEDETSSAHELIMKTRTEGFNDIVKERILTGNFFLLAENYEAYYVKAMKIRRLIAQDFGAVWNNNIDLLLTPTTLTAAPSYTDFVSLDNQTQCLNQDFCTQPANMAGLPAINIPIKLSEKQLPLSLQLMAPNFHEDRLFAVAKWLESVANFPRLELKDACIVK